MRKVFFLFLALILSGCATVRVEKYHKDIVYPATEPDRVLVYTAKPEGRAFVEIGHITVEGAGSWAQVERIFKIKAAEIGGDAVYLFSKTENKSQTIVPHACHFGYAHYGHRYYGPVHFNRYPYRGDPFDYYYCYGYQSTVETTTFISAVGVVIKF